MSTGNGQETAVIFDTEVAGMEHKEVVQLAYTVIGQGDGMIVTKGGRQSRTFKPEHGWEAGAVAVHGIIPYDVDIANRQAKRRRFSRSRIT